MPTKRVAFFPGLYYNRIMPHKLPIGIQSFEDIRTQDYVYVDKTHFIEKLTQQGKFFFLSRPRRFGKSLFIDTLDAAFSGKKELFTGLQLEHRWNWSISRPVIRMTFAGSVISSLEQLRQEIFTQLKQNALRFQVRVESHTYTNLALADLILQTKDKYKQRPVVLIDEYDKPVLDLLEQRPLAHQAQEELRNFYSTLKARDNDLEFVFLTGVTKFSKVSLFSGLNNLYDLTLDPQYSTICGYTESDLELNFAPWLTEMDRAKIKHWYNGYTWGGDAVYNPYDVLLLLHTRQFRTHWFETGTPSFLIKLLKEGKFYTPKLEQLIVEHELLSAFDVDTIPIEALLWQTGYLTISRAISVQGFWGYELVVPNLEVRQALNKQILSHWLPQGSKELLPRTADSIWRAFLQGDSEFLRMHFEGLYASIPHDWYRHNPITQYEGYWASVFYSHLAAMGFDIRLEDATNQGQCDLTLVTDQTIWIIEFKVVKLKATGEALQQLQTKQYDEKYRQHRKEIFLLGIEFSSQKRQIVAWNLARSSASLKS